MDERRLAEIEAELARWGDWKYPSSLAYLAVGRIPELIAEVRRLCSALEAIRDGDDRSPDPYQQAVAALSGTPSGQIPG